MLLGIRAEIGQESDILARVAAQVAVLVGDGRGELLGLDHLAALSMGLSRTQSPTHTTPVPAATKPWQPSKRYLANCRRLRPLATKDWIPVSWAVPKPLA